MLLLTLAPFIVGVNAADPEIVDLIESAGFEVVNEHSEKRDVDISQNYKNKGAGATLTWSQFPLHGSLQDYAAIASVSAEGERDRAAGSLSGLPIGQNSWLTDLDGLGEVLAATNTSVAQCQIGYPIQGGKPIGPLTAEDRQLIDCVVRHSLAKFAAPPDITKGPS